MALRKKGGRPVCDVNLNCATLQENREVALAICYETNKGVDEGTVQVLIRPLKAAMLKTIQKRMVTESIA